MSQPLLSAHDLVRAHGTRTVLAGVSLSIDDGSRVALVGPNGAGKSTLLRLLAGAEPPDGGRVVRARGAAVLHLPQLDHTGDPRPVRMVLHERLGVAAAEEEMDRLAERLTAGEDVVAGHGSALERWLARGGADVDARLDRAAADAGLAPALLERPGAALSGGQRARAMLAAITAARAEVLLLDEPANHLDADGLARLRALLLARAGGLVLVAHDRALLAAVSDRVVALDAPSGTAAEFAGGWAAYETERDRALRCATDAHDRAVAERDRLRSREREMRGRGGGVARKASAERDKFVRHAMRQGIQRSADGLASQMARRAERIEIPDRPWEHSAPTLAFAAGGSRAGVVAALRGAVLSRGEFTLGPLDLQISDGDRLLLAGPNGCGKSTILAALAGRLEPVRGQVHRVAGAIAEVAQQRSTLGDGGDVVAGARARGGLSEREARAALAGMGLDQALVARPARTLSPGERTRAELAIATAAGARLLLLDEPTNHLDVEALQALERALESWPGALVVATHDARLREGLRLDRTLEVGAR